MEICTGCGQEKKWFHGRKCKECRAKYSHERWLRRNRKKCPICKKEHNLIGVVECSTKCKILNRHYIENECWNWIGKLSDTGYGCFSEKREGKNKDLLSHRCSYENFIGEIPKGMLVLHKCDNPRCCNPEHLFLGTHKDNMQDALKKGRLELKKLLAAKGENNGSSKLKEEQVIQIREKLKSGRTGCSLAKEYNVCTSAISYIRNGNTWKYLKN